MAYVWSIYRAHISAYEPIKIAHVGDVRQPVTATPLKMPRKAPWSLSLLPNK